MITLKKLVGDPVIWRRLHDERIGLLHVWHDRVAGCFYAYAVIPAVPDGEAHWSAEFDDRPRIMASADTAQEAVLKLFDHPNREFAPSLGRSIAAFSVEAELLAGAYRDRH